MVRLKTLQLHFETLKMKETQTVDKIMTRASGIVTQFQTYGEPLEHKVVVQNILRCITKKFSMIETTIELKKNICLSSP